MADTAAHLVDHVLPDVPIRQWVLSVPHALRYRMAYDSKLMGRVFRIFARVVFQQLRRRAREHGVPEGRCGAVSFVQRFGSALNLHLHVHMLALDGVYAALPGSFPASIHSTRPNIKMSCGWRLRWRRGQQRCWKASMGGSDDDSLFLAEPWLAGLYSAAVSNRVATGRRAGRREPPIRRITAMTAIIATMLLSAPATPAAAPADTLPAQLSDAEFWRLVTEFSEPNGPYPYENYVGNEVMLQRVIPAARKEIKPGGVYIGVGPEQNFTCAGARSKNGVRGRYPPAEHAGAVAL